MPKSNRSARPGHRLSLRRLRPGRGNHRCQRQAQSPALE
ncbi:hypothetical protein [Pseudomonas sp. MWU16-30323]|nr:hypothetical protein [Pseudomonas sp. MWU16-30323]